MSTGSGARPFPQAAKHVPPLVAPVRVKEGEWAGQVVKGRHEYRIGSQALPAGSKACATTGRWGASCQSPAQLPLNCWSHSSSSSSSKNAKSRPQLAHRVTGLVRRRLRLAQLALNVGDQ